MIAPPSSRPHPPPRAGVSLVGVGWGGVGLRGLSAGWGGGGCGRGGGCWHNWRGRKRTLEGEEVEEGECW